MLFILNIFCLIYRVTYFCILFLVKVSDWNLFRVNQNYSDSFRYPYPSQCESFRTNQSDLIRLTPRHQSEWIRTNPKPSFQSRSIRINPSSDWSQLNFQSEWIRMNPRSERFGLILIENSLWINPSLDCFGLIWIENMVPDWFGFIRINVSEWIGLSRIDFLPFFIKWDTKRFSDWFRIIRIG